MNRNDIVQNTELAESAKTLIRPPASNRQQWLRWVFERYQGPLIAYSMRLLSNNLDASRDCVQDTFTALCRQPAEQIDAHIEAWLFTACRNRAMDHYRRETLMQNKLHHVARERVARDREESTHVRDPSQLVEDQDEQARMMKEIAKLPEREQEVLTLRLNEGLSYKQIASMTGMSVSHVGVTLHQAVTRLRSVLSAC